LDLAVNRDDFPVIKTDFSRKGARKFVTISANNAYKNLGYLSEIALANPQIQISWIGGKDGEELPGVTSLGYVDFQSNAGKDLLKKFDFLIMTGKSDANPTTILEAMAWGLIPICTPQSGYEETPGMINIPLGKSNIALDILNRVNQTETKRLKEMQAYNWQSLDTYFNWNRFSDVVLQAIESNESPRIENHLFRRSILYYYSLIAHWDSTLYSKIFHKFQGKGASYWFAKKMYRSSKKLVEKLFVKY
jgi:hypothetical protein